MAKRQYDIYIASPFFNEEQLERLGFIKEVLKQNDLCYFSPMDECLLPFDAPMSQRKKVFHDNCKAICSSTFVLGVTDGKDMGTIWECGYAFAQNIPIIYFAETLGDRPFNLMLAESGVKVLRTRDQLAQYLEKVLLQNVSFEREDFHGNIE